MVYGPSGLGKTTVAATFSKHWPKSWPPKKGVVLKDMFWISVDGGATNSLGQFGVSIPEIALRDDLMSPPKKGETKTYVPDLINAMAHILKVAEEMVVNHGVECLVLDTASQLNNDICAYWDAPQRHPGPGPQYWGKVKNTEGRFFPNLMRLPCHLIILCHEKQIIDMGDDGAKKRVKALTPVGPHEFLPAISGSALGDYVQNMDVALSLLGSQRLKTKQFARKLHPLSAEGHMGKCRFQHLLDLEEEPDLRKLFNKLEKRKNT